MLEIPHSVGSTNPFYTDVTVIYLKNADALLFKLATHDGAKRACEKNPLDATK